jgi:phosphoglycerate dehydrogenase-like enzyme
MTHVVIEQDAFMRMFLPMLDPSASDEYLNAVADFFSHDEPDFSSWLRRVRTAIPCLFPARVSLAEDQEHFRELLRTADACLIESLRVGEEELAEAPNLAVVQKYGFITRNIDTQACARRGVHVTVQRRRVNVSLAEEAFALLSGMGKQLFELNKVIDAASLEKAGYSIRPYDKRYTGGSNFARIPGLKVLQGATLGIVGFGEAGRELGKRAAAFEMRVLYHQRTPLSAAEETFYGARYASLDELLRESDYVSVNLPVTPQTTGIIGRAQFEVIKKGAILINVARPELVDREALFEALDSGALAGYGTDVWYDRPAKPDDKVFGYPNVVVMPHIAIASRKQALLDTEEMFLKMSAALCARQTGA